MADIAKHGCFKLPSIQDSHATSTCDDSGSGDSGRDISIGSGGLLPLSDAANMSLQAPDALSRTFQELKSKNQDTRLKASYELYGLITATFKGTKLDYDPEQD